MVNQRCVFIWPFFSLFFSLAEQLLPYTHKQELDVSKYVGLVLVDSLRTKAVLGIDHMVDTKLIHVSIQMLKSHCPCTYKYNRQDTQASGS